MWSYVFISATSLIFLCLLIIGSYRRPNIINNASVEVNLVNAVQQLKRESFGEVSRTDGKLKKRIHIPKFMLDLYEARKHDGYSLNLSKPDIVRSVIPKNAGTIQNKNVLQSYEENHLLVFDIPPSTDDEVLLDAELRLLTLINVNDLIAGVERYLMISVYNESFNDLQLLEVRHLYHTTNTWIKFNVTAPVNRLLRRYTDHHLLRLVVTVKSFLPYLPYDANRFKLSLLPETENIEHDYPILLLSYVTLKKAVHTINRNKRNTLDEDYEEETNRIWDNQQQSRAQSRKIKRLKNTCRRKQLYVDFAEIQYDTWIVQPSGYEAYQCIGKCFYPVAEHLSPTKHAIVQALLHSVSPSRATRSCCVPTRLGSISLLYVDDKGVLTYRYGYDDMVVAECGCR